MKLKKVEIICTFWKTFSQMKQNTILSKKKNSYSKMCANTLQLQTLLRWTDSQSSDSVELVCWSHTAAEATVGLYGCFRRNIWIWLFSLDQTFPVWRKRFPTSDQTDTKIQFGQTGSLNKMPSGDAKWWRNSWSRNVVQSKWWYATSQKNVDTRTSHQYLIVEHVLPHQTGKTISFAFITLSCWNRK